MKVTIGGLELSDVSLDELDQLVLRYGNQSKRIAKGGANKSSNGSIGALTNHPTDDPDTTVLQKLVAAGDTGTSTKAIGEILGRRGKATRGAVKQWAQRIGLTKDQNAEPVEDCRIDTMRALRIKPSLLAEAKAILEKR